MGKKALEYFNGDELAANVWESKYAVEGEETPDDMHKRMAKEFYRVDLKFQEEFLKELGKREREANRGIGGSNVKNVGDLFPELSQYGRDREELSYKSIFEYFKNFKYIIPQGSIMYGLGRTDKYVSLSNCFFVGSPRVDSYGGIFEKDEQLAQLMKRRAGVGIDISSLRPRGAEVTNSAGTSTGSASFMERFSNTTREVGQENRRGALLISIDVKHPDSEEFAVKKEDLTKVTGANVSIKLSDEFMESVENDEDFIQTFPTDININDHTAFIESLMDGKIEYNKLYNLQYKGDEGYENCYAKRIRAKDLWDTIVRQARNNSEPGLLFWDNVLNYGPDGVYDEYKPYGTNPCGEITLSPMDSCRLMLINLFSFVKNPFKSNSEIDYNKLYEVSYENQRLMDNLVDLELESVKKMLDKIEADEGPLEIKEREISLWKEIYKIGKSGRRTGSGITALGDMIAAMGVPYDSKDALNIARKVMRTKMEAELDCSIDLAIMRGSFKGWDVLNEFSISPEGIPTGGRNKFFQMIYDEFPEQAYRMMKYGRRNVSWSTIAPAGSVSILTQTTSGCEPVFKAYYIRRKKINHSDTDSRVDFIDGLGDKWQEYPVIHPKFKYWIKVNSKELGIKDENNLENLDKNEVQKYFEKSPWYKSEAEDIDWIKRVEMQSILQSATSHSISSTVNLPENVTEKEVSEIYFQSWKMGLKGITIYRDGSRSGVLVSDNSEKKGNFESAIEERPKDVECFAHKSTSKGIKYSVLVGLVDNRPFEVFITEGKAQGNGIIRKVGKGKYKFVKVGGNEYEEDITANMSFEQAAITRMVSGLLKYSKDLPFVMEQLDKCSGSMFDFTGSLKRVLSKYVKTEEGLKCSECGENSMIMEEGCKRCVNPECGFTAC